MRYLIDTNVLSELVKIKPNSNVLSWFSRIPDESLYLSVLTLGEIRKGVELMTDKHRKSTLLIWLEHDLPKWFEHRILAVDREVVDRWGRLLAEVKYSLPAIDSLIAATALHYDLSLVSRNARDFKAISLEIINPWHA